ncbi:MAG: type V CRISPR-associated protein Cas12a/Cpf1 [Phascolarctobacterium sp.]|nr:type V CRISPR-associated protein Cas12a/Cpf1 [Phascolarctobacterium sp.]
MTTLAAFTKQYQVQKTLRFELIPQGKTQENIDARGFINEDLQRDENYEKVKILIDDVHKKFIEKTLRKVNYSWNELAVAVTNYRRDKSDNNKKNLTKEQEKARKEIIGWFTGKCGSTSFKKAQKEYFEKLFKEKLFKEILRDETLGFNADIIAAIDGFDRFTTYFVGFHENRKNMYSSDEKSTSIAYRLVNENFPKFLSNCEAFTTLVNVCPDVIAEAEQELREHEAFNNIVLADVFTIDSYNAFLSQRRIDYYNQIIGGVSATEGSRKIRGINEVINNAIQQNAELKVLLRNKQFTMTQLFKQILSDRESMSFVAEQFDDDQEALEAVKCYNAEIISNKTLDVIKKLFENFRYYDLSKIYISAKELSNVSVLLFKQWNKIRDVVYDAKKATLGDNPSKAKLALLDKELKTKDFSITELSAYEDSFVNKEGGVCPICNIVNVVLDAVDMLQELTHGELPENLQTFDNKNKVKSILDAYENLLHILNCFKVSADNDIDLAFYGDFDKVYCYLSKVMPLYNKVRNYSTKKPYSVGKFKLNFAMPTLATGWDKNKERENGSIILLKDGQYYLGIMNPQDKPNIDECINADDNGYQKMIYKMFPDIAKMLPKCTTQLNPVKEHFTVSEDDFVLSDNSKFESDLVITKEIYNLNNVTYDDKKKFQIDYLRNTGDVVGYHQALKTWIDFAKDFLSKYKSTAIYDFSTLLSSDMYERIDLFYADVGNICYKISYENISVEQVDEWVNNGKLYLFKIYNKDFAPGATGRPNLHTLYWKAIFEDENLQDVVIKLNGGAELFYRSKSNIPKIAHKVGEKLVNRKDINGIPIADSVYKELYAWANGKIKEEELSASAKEAKAFAVIKDVKHEIIKDRRFLSDKYFFHVPITLNYKASSNPSGFNIQVQNFLRNNPDVNIIGIDRGERNLLYVVAIDQKGNIIERKQISYNKVNGYDYYEKLNQREKERTEARQAWDIVGKIKELKEGYLSLVIREIADMMVKYNAIVVMENLNVGFKRIRSGLAEKAVYQKFEKMLIDKLNYLVFKDAEAGAVGGVLNAYQLTDKFDSFEKLGNQSGLLFYVPAAYTSKIDPLTGFANVFSTKHITNTEAKKEFICNFDSLVYDEEKDKFILDCNLDNFKVVATSFLKSWKFIIGGKRIVYNSKDKTYITKYPCEDLKTALITYGIDYSQSDLLDVLDSKPADREHSKLFNSVYWAIMNTLQMRNSNAATGEDYIISAVANETGKVFDSRTCGDELPKDADANGAYHIALKGLYLLQQINAVGENERVDLGIKNEDWFKFVQTKEYVK